MSLTLTAGAATEKEELATSFDVLVESEELGLRYSFATEDAGGFTWEHRLLYDGIGDIVRQVDPGGGLAAGATLRLQVIDDNAGSSPTALFNSFGRLKGADLTLSLLFEGEDYADKIVRFSGRISAHRRSGMIMQLEAVDELFPSDRLLPSTLIPEGTEDAPDASIGRALPILYGDGATIGLAPLLRTDATLREYRLAGHAIRQFVDNLAIWIESASKAKLGGFGTVALAEAKITLDSPATAFLFGFEAATRAIQRESDVDGSLNAIDELQISNAMIHTDSGTNADGDGYGYLGVSGAFEDPDGLDTIHFQIRQRGNPIAATTLFAHAVVRIIDSLGTVVIESIRELGELRFYSSIQLFQEDIKNFAISASQRVEVFIEAINEGGLGGSNDFWRVYDVDFWMYAQARSEDEQLYAFETWQGRPDDGAGTFTGTAGGLITRPSDVIWSIMSLELGMPVDMASAVTARSRLTSWEFGGGIGAGWWEERQTAREFLHQLGVQCKSIIFPLADGFHILPHSNDDPSAYDFDTDTILWEAGTSAETPPSERQSTFHLDPEHINQVWNSFEVHFAYHPALSKFGGFRFASPAGTNSAQGNSNELVVLCTNSASRHGHSNTLVINCPFICDATTAELLLDFVVRYFWEARLPVEFETGTQGLHLTLGDMITIDYPDIPSSLIGEKFEVHRITDRFIPTTTPWGSPGLSYRIQVLASRQSAVDIDFIAIKDQNDEIHWLYLVQGPTPFMTEATGDFESDAFDEEVFTVAAPPELNANDITPETIPYWLEITAADDAATLYLYPLYDGTIFVDTSPPAIGTGYDVGDGLFMRGLDGVRWRLSAISANGNETWYIPPQS